MKTKFKIGEKVVFFQKKNGTNILLQAIVGTIKLIKYDGKIMYEAENFHDVNESDICKLDKAPKLLKTFLDNNDK